MSYRRRKGIGHRRSGRAVESTGRRTLGVGAALLASGAMVVAGAAPAEADWAGDNCWFTGGSSYPPQTKGDMFLRNYSAVNEGYHWGGGCWNNNETDDSPNEQEETFSPRGEGPDCSGLVFKTWGITSADTTAFTIYHNLYFIHGPYQASSYRSATTAWKTIANQDATFMDVFASGSHVGLVYQVNGDGTDYMFEAKDEARGTGVWSRNYRSGGSYTAAARHGWA